MVALTEHQIRVMCCTNPDRTARELDNAITVLGGWRDVVLQDELSYWDSWFITTEKAYLVVLFLTRPQDVWLPNKPGNHSVI